MAYDPAEALRAAGMVDGTLPPELEAFYAGLTQEETETLISLKNRLDAVMPDVVAHSQDWATPEATQQGFDAAMMCFCSIWSGSGGKADA
jgi:hypothetical protein